MRRLSGLIMFGGGGIVALSASCAMCLLRQGFPFAGEEKSCTIWSYWLSDWFFLTLLGILISVLGYWYRVPFGVLLAAPASIGLLLFWHYHHGGDGRWQHLIIIPGLFFLLALCTQGIIDVILQRHWDSQRHWEVFISHASEDKVSFVEPLVRALKRRRVRVWYDTSVLAMGDKLTDKINEGIEYSKFGVVVLSPYFFTKEWPQREFKMLQELEKSDGRTIILPVLHNMKQEEVVQHSKELANRLTEVSSKGPRKIAKAIVRATSERGTPPPKNQAELMLS